jgi:tryptophan synthase alpha chain
MRSSRRVGEEQYLMDAQAAGFCGAIVPDLLAEEADSLRALCRARDFSLIHLVTPTTPPEAHASHCRKLQWLSLFVSITGITGERNQLPSDLVDKVSWLRERTELPICIGFGISQVEHVRLLAPVADGLIVGSALVRRMSQDLPPAELLASVQALASQLMAAMEES